MENSPYLNKIYFIKEIILYIKQKEMDILPLHFPTIYLYFVFSILYVHKIYPYYN